jgi:hypothetical protein
MWLAAFNTARGMTAWAGRPEVSRVPVLAGSRLTSRSKRTSARALSWLADRTSCSSVGGRARRPTRVFSSSSDASTSSPRTGLLERLAEQHSRHRRRARCSPCSEAEVGALLVDLGDSASDELLVRPRSGRPLFGEALVREGCCGTWCRSPCRRGGVRRMLPRERGMPLEPPTSGRLHALVWVRSVATAPSMSPVEQHRATVIAHLGSIAGQETPQVAVLGRLA